MKKKNKKTILKLSIALVVVTLVLGAAYFFIPAEVVFYSPLHMAILDQDHTQIEALIEQGQDLDTPAITPMQEGLTPLMYMAKDLEIPQKYLKQICDKGAFINTQSYDGKTALMYAIEYQNIEAVKTLLDYQPDLTLYDQRGLDTLDFSINLSNGFEIPKLVIHHLIQHPSEKSVLSKGLEQLLVYLAQLNPAYTPIYAEVKTRYKPLMAQLLNMLEKAPELTNRDYELLLMGSAMLGDSSQIEDWVKSGHTLNLAIKNYPSIRDNLQKKYKDNINLSTRQYSLLSMIVSDGNIPLLKLLLEQGADPNYYYSENQISHFQSALDWARESKEKTHQLFDILLESGADPNTQYDRWGTPLFNSIVWSYEDKSAEFTKRLLDAGADPNYVDLYKGTALKVACEKNKSKIVKALLEAGADPNLSTNLTNTKEVFGTHSTALLAVTFTPELEDPSSLEVIDLLFKYGADPNLQEQIEGENSSTIENTSIVRVDQSSALMYAAGASFFSDVEAQRKREMVKKLLAHGADPNLKDSHGDTALHLVIRDGYKPENDVQIIQLLLDAGADPTIKNQNGKSPLKLAKKRKDERITQVLK